MSVISPKDVASPPLTGLREQVRRLERAHSTQRAGRSAVSLGLPEIDALLPGGGQSGGGQAGGDQAGGDQAGGGLLTGALHEIEAGPAPSGRVAPHDGAALGFTAYMLGRFGPGTILWCRQPLGVFDAPPYAPALAQWFDPARLLMVTARREEDLFWAMEEGLRTPGIAAVVGEFAHSHARAVDSTAGRRLSLAAEKNGVPALLLRAQPAPPQGVCTTRWRVASAPSPEILSVGGPGIEMLGAARWRVELRRNRFGTPSIEEMPSWLLEWNDEAHHLSVVPQAFHGSLGASRRTGTQRAGAPWRERLAG
jgi:protein ImuA